ncbi:ABC transporter ATP-binding protein (plasmid) [Aminobacter sp. SR38]|jgi:oligopeptide/dipeptide ABC transporter ATP-binding protein|uniref:oligopeptide/dipeptide ABC transporter ATP-binding protein n=1 Tax=Aminobacter sp. SR38 TaxID=2774562 RepID=UPI00177CBF0D|nr:oligopeptide/dipeptide ABC transporter ATP-binding protein [Aminobacter sp. SR38]QOF75507.1 ABC transporter ATP-binding protein [Aminobacter sp. SR38]
MQTELLHVDNLVKHFSLGGNRYIGAVNDVSFVLRRGETLGLVGESGSGKSTIGRCILGIEPPTAGSVTFDGQPIFDSRGAFRQVMRRRLQLVFQDPSASLNPRRTVAQTISEPLQLSGARTAKEMVRPLDEILDAVGLCRELLHEYPISLSPSEQQRVGIARALVMRPDVVVLDEPTSLLDPTVRADIIDLLLQFQKQHGTSYLFISHDMEAVGRLSHRIAVLYLGRLVEEAEARTIFKTQCHPYSMALLRSVLPPDPNVTLPAAPISGEIPSAINPVNRCPFVPRCPEKIAACSGTFPSFTVGPGKGRVACYASGSQTSEHAPEGSFS